MSDRRTQRTITVKELRKQLSSGGLIEPAIVTLSHARPTTASGQNKLRLLTLLGALASEATSSGDRWPLNTFHKLMCHIVSNASRLRQTARSVFRDLSPLHTYVVYPPRRRTLDDDYKACAIHLAVGNGSSYANCKARVTVCTPVPAAMDKKPFLIEFDNVEGLDANERNRFRVFVEGRHAKLIRKHVDTVTPTTVRDVVYYTISGTQSTVLHGSLNATTIHVTQETAAKAAVAIKLLANNGLLLTNAFIQTPQAFSITCDRKDVAARTLRSLPVVATDAKDSVDTMRRVLNRAGCLQRNSKHICADCKRAILKTAEHVRPIATAVKELHETLETLVADKITPLEDLVRMTSEEAEQAADVLM